MKQTKESIQAITKDLRNALQSVQDNRPELENILSESSIQWLELVLNEGLTVSIEFINAIVDRNAKLN